MKLSVVIVNYKSLDKLTKCLHSLVEANWRDLEHEIIVVDNASGDKLEGLLEIDSNLKLIYSEENLGMGGGNNLGIKESQGDYILIANPDLIFDAEAPYLLYEYLSSHQEAAIVGPRLLNPDSSLQYSCARFPGFFLPVLRRTFIGKAFFPYQLDRYLMRNDDHQETIAVDWLMGACFLVRREDWHKEELFDSRFFMYFEDVDLCRRAWKKGKEVVYLPIARVTHDHQRESAKKAWYRALLSESLAREHLLSWMKYFLKWGLSRKRPVIKKK